MSKQTRRRLLKTAGYSALALAGMNAGLAGAAMRPQPVADSTATKIMNQSLRFVGPERDIKLYLQQPVGEERITLINNSQHSLKLNSKQPLQLKNINGSLVLQLNKSQHAGTTLASGDVLIFDVQTNSRTVRISSAHPAFKQYFSNIA